MRRDNTRTNLVTPTTEPAPCHSPQLPTPEAIDAAAPPSAALADGSMAPPISGSLAAHAAAAIAAPAGLGDAHGLALGGRAPTRHSTTTE